MTPPAASPRTRPTPELRAYLDYLSRAYPPEERRGAAKGREPQVA